MAALASKPQAPDEATQKYNVIWRPQPGPQTYLLSCPVTDIFYGGARGGGKTDGMLGHWIKHHEQYGAKAQGIIFRKRYKQLERIKKRGKQLFGASGARWIDSKDGYKFVWPDGAELLLRHLKTADDAEEYQGHEYNWMGCEELTQWPDPAPIDMVRAALRSAENVQCWFIANGNPGGSGHQWVKDRYIMPAPPMTPFIDEQELNGRISRVTRVFIPAKVWDNKILLESDPTYVDRLAQSGPGWLVDAWLMGDWDIIAGGYLEGIWKHDKHVVRPFDIPMHWKRWRAMDWGFAAPYSVGWYTQNENGKIFRYRELYGYGGKPNVGTRENVTTVAQKVYEMEKNEIKAGINFMRNPADSACWTNTGTDRTVASQFNEFRAPNNKNYRCRWRKASKGPGSRINGAQLVVELLAVNNFAVFNTNRHFIRTVPVIPSDPDNLEDVDTDAEDHIWDEVRYSLTSRHKTRAKPEGDGDVKPFSWEWLTQGTDKKAVSKYKTIG